jgi:3-hydroxy-9,10-secoandrosta-1,3,5(10)-triene-9,17-dione monooxygenase reductase component
MSQIPAVAANNAMELRRALGSFATGVTIITTRSEDGQPVGLTVNSFNSVSLNPPLVLWSLANSSRSHEAFQKAGYWAVHVLATNQQELSGRFARTGQDKFAGLEWDEGVGGIPLLRDCTARFQCRAAFQYEGGDHLIFVGEVVEFDWTETAPLVFHAGRYAHAIRPEAADSAIKAAAGIALDPELSLVELIRRTAAAISDRTAPLLAAEHLSIAEFEQLARCARLAAADRGLQGPAFTDATCADTIKTLISRHLLRATQEHPQGANHELTEAGAACLARVMAAISEMEAEWRVQLGAADAATLTRLLAQWSTAIKAGPKPVAS